MTTTDFIIISLNNIKKNKLRSVLTILGVAVAIGALTSMLSFGIGMQENISNEIMDNSLINRITVTPEDNQIISDTAILTIEEIKGVEKAFIETRIPVKIGFSEKSISTTIKPVPFSYSNYFADDSYISGKYFKNDTAFEIILTEDLLDKLLKNQDSTYIRSDSLFNAMIGKYIVVTTVTIDKSFFSNVFASMSKIMKNELPLKDSLISFKIAGIVKRKNRGDWGTRAYISETIGRSIPQLNFEDIWDLLEKEEKPAIQALTVFTSGIKETQSVQNEIKKMGFQARSFLDNMEELKKAFIIMDSILGAIGIMALFISILGLVNTLIMSIYERTREIGILKSLGAKNREVRKLFIIESGCIGLIGTFIGIPAGWGITRLINVIFFSTLFKDFGEKIDLFLFPWYLIIGAFLFAFLFSVLAGLYPAMKAAKIDPVKALRHE